MSNKTEATVIAKTRAGKADEAELNAAIAEAWRFIVTDPKQRPVVADLLGVRPDELDPEHPPLQAEMSGAGLTGGEVLIVLASAFVLGFVKEVGGALGKEAAKRLHELWEDHLRDRVSPPGSRKLGKEIEQPSGD